MTAAHYFQPFVVSPPTSLKTGLSNHERLRRAPPSTLLRAGFDKLRANGLYRIRLNA